MSKYFTQGSNNTPVKKSVVKTNRNKLHMKQLKFPVKFPSVQYCGNFNIIYDFAKKHIPDVQVYFEESDRVVIVEYRDKTVTLEFSDWLMLQNDNLHVIKNSYFFKHYETENDLNANVDAIVEKTANNKMIG